jgi:hypothetical protein
MVEAVDAPQTLFGVGYRVETMLRTFPPSKYIPMPNFTKIYKVWFIVLYILDKFRFKMYTNDTSQEPSFVCLNANQEKSTY